MPPSLIPHQNGECATPISDGSRLADMLGVDIELWIKRDDLYPQCGGGIKSRKIQHIWKDVIAGGHDAVVTTGGPQSNHARATAIKAAETGTKCHLVIVLEPGATYLNTGNILLMQMTGATIEYCEKHEIATRMDAAIERLRSGGSNPLYIWGGGHCVSGTRAFVDASEEAIKQMGDQQPDYLVAASGTGSTQAGFAIGYSSLCTKVVGISVARPKQQGIEVIRQCVHAYQSAYSSPQQMPAIDFRDEWTDGGYEKTSPRLLELVQCAARAGVFVDTTYSGKGLRGLTELVQRKEIRAGSRVLFWHTGGLMNLQAAEFAGGPLTQ